MPAPKTELENYLVYGIDEKNRRLYFGMSLAHAGSEEEVCNVTQCSIEYAIRAIDRMAQEYPKVPIEIHFSSWGGDPYSMLALYDVIQSAPCQIKFYGRGAIMSAGTWIMCGCDERYLFPNSTILVHDGSTVKWGSFTNVKISVEEEMRLQDKLEQIYADNSIMPKSFWEMVSKRDLYLTAEETIALGLADKIVQPKKRGNYRKIRQEHLNNPIDSSKLTKLTDRLIKRIHLPKKIEITLNSPKIEQIDENLTIESKPVEVKDDSNTK